MLDEDIIAKLAEEGAEGMSVHHQQIEALDTCIVKLPRERRDIAPETSRNDIAAHSRRTKGPLYQLLARIRQELLLSPLRSRRARVAA